MTDAELKAERRRLWGQTREDRVPDPDAATQFIDRVGITTLFPASPEVPNLYHAYMGDPDAQTDSRHDSPSGHVYEWRWHLGRREAGFYSLVVRKRPTWVSWELLPAILRLNGEMRTPDELYDLAIISPAAYRIACALEASGGVLTTSDLRREAGFPTGKEQRNAYLKAVEELDTRLLLAKVFSEDSYDMSHALVAMRYPEHLEAAERTTREEALEHLLRTYLRQAMYAVPAVLARHMGLPEDDLLTALNHLATSGMVRATSLDGYKGQNFVLEEQA